MSLSGNSLEDMTTSHCRSPIYGQISHDHGLVPISAKLVVTTSVNRAVLSIGVNFRGTPVFLTQLET